MDVESRHEISAWPKSSIFHPALMWNRQHTEGVLVPSGAHPVELNIFATESSDMRGKSGQTSAVALFILGVVLGVVAVLLAPTDPETVRPTELLTGDFSVSIYLGIFSIVLCIISIVLYYRSKRSQSPSLARW